MKRILLILCAVVFLQTLNCAAYTIQYSEEPGRPINNWTVNYNYRTTQAILNNLKLDVLGQTKFYISRNRIPGMKAYCVPSKNYIVIADKSGEFGELYSTITHEVGHLLLERKISIRMYAREVQNRRHVPNKVWEESFEENFCEDFKMYMVEKQYPELFEYSNIFKKTNMPYYKERFKKLIKRSGFE